MRGGRPRLAQVGSDQPGDGLNAGANAEALTGLGEMVVDRARRDLQTFTDLTRRQTRRRQSEAVEMAIRKGRVRSRCSPRGAQGVDSGHAPSEPHRDFAAIPQASRRKLAV